MSQISSPQILTLNSGSSSLKFGVYEHRSPKPRPLVRGKIENIGSSQSVFSLDGIDGRQKIPCADAATASDHILNYLREQGLLSDVKIVSHRIVFGGDRFTGTSLLSKENIAELSSFKYFDPAHLPSALSVIDRAQAHLPNVIHVGCFDSSFHSSLPDVAKTLPIPFHFRDEGIRKFGFHGLSYQSLMQRMEEMDLDPKRKRIILAHLGSGSSLAAVHHGVCVETTMGFTPLGGVMMGTRSGDLDPGVCLYILKTQNADTQRMEEMLWKDSGMKGISGTSNDSRELERLALQGDKRAALALAMYCYHVKKQIGALASVMGGLDALVFSGGIGEHSSLIRERILSQMEFLGIEIESQRNHENSEIISKQNSAVLCCVIPTDEEGVMAIEGQRFLSESV